MISSLYVLGSLMRSRLFGLSYCPIVVTEDYYGLSTARNDVQFLDEVLYPNTFLSCFRSSYVLRFSGGVRDSGLLVRFPSHCSSIEQEYISGRCLEVIYVGLET